MCKTVILCGGTGVRLSEETKQIPKPMVRIGNIPILFHVMQIYNHYDLNEFILTLGYKQELIRDYFLNFSCHNSDMKVSLRTNNIKFLKRHDYDMEISLIDTGENTLTGNRLLKVAKYIHDDYFCLTYADGVANINLKELIEFHKKHGKLVTLTAVQNRSKFGTIKVKDNQVISFIEKPLEENYINGGFMVMSRKVFEHIEEGDLTITLNSLSKMNELMCYTHLNDWACVDTMRDLNELNELWNTNKAFWKIW